MKLNTIQLDNRQVAYAIHGTGKIDVVVEMGLGACLAEWQPFAERFTADGEHTILVYERAGMQKSTPSTLERTPANIAAELAALLDALKVENKVILLGHSQGGLYAQQFARSYPDKVKALVVLDPLSAQDGLFKEKLTPKEFKQGGIDKFASLGPARTMAKLYLGGMIKAVMKSAPPMCYYAFRKEEAAYILSSYTKVATYDTMMAEYRLAHEPQHIAQLKVREGFPNIPVVLVTHTSELAIGETMQFGGATRETAEKVETLWQEIMGDVLTFSDRSAKLQAKKSTHYIHLMEPSVVEEAISLAEGL